MSAAIAFACPQQQRATFTVRRSGSAFVVVRELSGFNVLPDGEVFTSAPMSCPKAANTFAYDASERFQQRYPNFVADVRPLPTFDPFTDFGSFDR